MSDNYFGITDIGKMRTNNEDTFIAKPLADKGFILACVIDGLGGYEGGEVAAEIAGHAIQQVFVQPFTNIISAIKESIRLANADICRQRQSSAANAQMACVLTLAVADIASNKFYYGHVGDTRLYLLRDNTLVKISHDHSFVGFLEDSGKISEHEAMSHARRHEINRALGFEQNLHDEDYIETGESPFLHGDIIMLCSDGLTDLVDNKTITGLLTAGNDLSVKAKGLINGANQTGGTDNITVVLVQNSKPATQHSATKPAAANSFMESEEKIKRPEMTGLHKENIPGKKLQRSGSGGLLAFLFILILIALGWVIYRYYYNQKQQQSEVADVAIKVRSPQEQLLLDSIAHTKTNEVFILNQPGSPPIAISDSIKVSNDTLHIIGNGATLVADSFYNGPAFILSKKCKRIVLDSLTLQNFDIGIIAGGKGFALKNVRFRNCRVPVQSQLLFGNDSVITGRIADTMFQKLDFKKKSWKNEDQFACRYIMHCYFHAAFCTIPCQVCKAN